MANYKWWYFREVSITGSICRETYIKYDMDVVTPQEVADDCHEWANDYCFSYEWDMANPPKEYIDKKIMIIENHINDLQLELKIWKHLLPREVKIKKILKDLKGM
jgi:hypothetical protein